MTLKNVTNEGKDVGNKAFCALPTGVDCRKTFLRSGRTAYVFHDARLGELGRLVGLPHQGQSQWLCEVSGAPDDPLTQKRWDVFTPIARTFLKTKQ